MVVGVEERWCSRRNGSAACSCSTGGELDSQRRLRDRGTITCWFLKDGRRNRALYAAPDDGRQEGLRMEGRMGLVASSAPWGWRRQRRIDGGIGRIGLDWRFIYLDITIFF